MRHGQFLHHSPHSGHGWIGFVKFDANGVAIDIPDDERGADIMLFDAEYPAALASKSRSQ
jgi:hypothetical protein